MYKTDKINKKCFNCGKINNFYGGFKYEKVERSKTKSFSFYLPFLHTFGFFI